MTNQSDLRPSGPQHLVLTSAIKSLSELTVHRERQKNCVGPHIVFLDLFTKTI